MNKYTFLICLFLGIQSYTQAQFSENLTSDRAGQTFLPYTVGKNVIQAQTGFTRYDFDAAPIVWNDANLLLRYGLFEKFEIFGSFGNTNSQIADARGISETQSYNDRAYGFGVRMNLYEGSGALPAVGVQAGYARAFDFDRLNLMLLLRSEFGEKFALGSNVVLDYDGIVSATIKPEFYPIDKLGIFAEGQIISSKIFAQDRFNQSIEYRWTTGAMYRISPKFMVDASVGEQWFPSDKFTFFLDFGLSYRFDWRK